MDRGRVLKCAAFSLVLVGGLLVPGVASGVDRKAGAARDPSRLGPTAVELTTNHAKVETFAFDGGGDVPDPVAIEATDVSAFSESVADSDQSTGRGGDASASQDTTVDLSAPTGVPDVSTNGTVHAGWVDSNPSDGVAPSAEATSEFTITFEVTGEPAGFRLDGTLSATADPDNASCTTVTVTSPDGETFVVSSPSFACGSPPALSIDFVGSLQPGTHSFSVVANAPASNPDATGGTADALFDLRLNLNVCTIFGTEDADTLVGDATEADVICGFGGNDRLEGLGGDDVIIGGPGEDVLLGGGGADTIEGDGDLDHIVGGSEGDHLEGGPGPDEILGGGGSDDVIGDGGSDLLLGGGDIDIIDGGPGNEVRDNGQSPGIFGGAGDDIIDGGPGDDLIEGGDGEDTIDGGPGSDKLRGQEEDDTLTGGTRKDVLVGGPGNDTLFARDGVRDDVLGGPGVNDQAQVDEGIDFVKDVEVLLA